MFESNLRTTGTRYTSTVALLVLGVIFSPALVALASPVGYWTIAAAAGGSALCLVLAWFDWKRHSNLTIPSIREDARPVLK